MTHSCELVKAHVRSVCPDLGPKTCTHLNCIATSPPAEQIVDEFLGRVFGTFALPWPGSNVGQWLQRRPHGNEMRMDFD